MNRITGELSIRFVATLLILTGLVIAFFGMIVQREDLSTGNQMANLLILVGVELVSLTATVIIFDALLKYREEQRLKGQLIRQLRSRHSDIATDAALELTAFGWLEDGSLVGADLRGANLQNAELFQADLKYVNLANANLRNASLWEASLQGTILIGANLEEADLSKANLEGADLSNANLEGARLLGANLERSALFRARLKEADLSEVNLEKAQLHSANLEGARLHSANLEWAAMSEANLEGVDLREARLSNAKISVQQLQNAETLIGAIMPDGTRIKGVDPGPSFEEWLEVQSTESKVKPEGDQADEHTLS